MTMKNKRVKFDSFTYFLEDFYIKEKRRLDRQRLKTIKDVFEPLTPFIGTKVPKKDSMDLLLSCSNIALNQLKETCSTHSIDVWLSIVRKFPRVAFNSRYWIAYATLAIIKWSDWEEDTTYGQVYGKNQFGVKFVLTEEDIFNCWKIAILAETVDLIVSQNRWISKGARLIITEQCFPKLEIPDDVKLAVEHYENRRQKQFILDEEGILVDIPYAKDMNSIIMLVWINKPEPLILPKNNKTLFLMNYFFRPIEPQDILSNLFAYEEAIDDKFGSGSMAIIQTLHSLSRHILETIPPLEISNDTLICNLDINMKKDLHRVKFFFDLCQRGYIRLPEQIFRERLPKYSYYPITRSKEHAIELVNAFFDNFILTEKTRKKIDVLLLEPYPILYTSPGGNCYFDLAFIAEFLRWVLSEGREWYSTQHGDRFTLALKKLIEERAKDTTVIAYKKKFASPKGENAEADLILKNGKILYIIECKAYSKSRAYWLGNPKSIYNRTAKITQSVNQVKKASVILKECLSVNNSNLPECEYVEWLVCTPTQEFINPIDKYGMLSKDIPKVCTPEELIDYFNGMYSTN